jgi:E3 ubiquitin-protein ligase synoviolin
MEGNERLNVEARIKVLRNIQVLLDAAVMEMSQYSAVVNRLNLNPTPVNVTAAPVNATAEAPVAPASAAATFVTPEETGTKPKAATASKPVPEQVEGEQLPQAAEGESSGSGATPLSDEQMELRRRRLEKFEKKDESPPAQQ